MAKQRDRGTPRITVTLETTETGRRMCHEQGKVFVHEPDDRPGTIVAEWPQGTVDTYDTATETASRRTANGTERPIPGDGPIRVPAEEGRR